MSSPPHVPPSFGHGRLPVHVIDQIAAEAPSTVCLSAPRTSSPADGWMDFTYDQLAKAVDRTAHGIVRQLGTPPQGTFPTIAYIGPNDLRYFVYTFAAIKAGYKAFFGSPRNTEVGQLSLFEATDCNVLYYARTHKAIVQPWLQKRAMQSCESESVDEMFDETAQSVAFPYSKSFEEGQWDPLAVLHTSGSTGIPKPIVIRQGNLAAFDSWRELPDFCGYEPLTMAHAKISRKLFSPLPLFHAGGVVANMMFMLYAGVQVALGVADRPLTSALALESLAHSGADSVVMPPSIYEELSQTEEGIEALRKMSSVTYIGGNLTPEAGNKLVQGGVKLHCLISSTECCPYLLYSNPDPENWEYSVFNDDLFGSEWRSTTGEDDVFQLFIVRRDKHPGLQNCFYTFPNEDEFNTQDLFKPHPTLLNLWKFYGRADSIIVFSNGEKLNPISIEEIVTSHPGVKDALVFGQDRFQPGLLIDPMQDPDNDDELSRLLLSIWGYVERANKSTVSHGRISQDFMIVTHSEKPLPRAGKGTVQRAGAMTLYSDEIDRLYEQADGTLSRREAKFDISSEEALEISISKLFQHSLGIAELDADTDFFTAGMDSLQVINGARLLRSGLETAGWESKKAAVANRDIYDNPTLHKLSAFIFSRSGHSAQNGLRKLDGEDRQNQIAEAMVAKYTKDMPISASNKPHPASTDQVVLLTGSTGSLGSYMLDLLIRSSSVATVICLNRGQDGGRQKQSEVNAKRGLLIDFAKVEFYHAGLSRHDLCLDRSVYANLLNRSDRIIHSAWPVNFNIGVETFEPHICGVRNLVDFASRCSKRVPIVFLSSLATVMGWAEGQEDVPETSLPDFALAEGGYGRSKLVASTILDEASENSGVPTASIRLGQIAGPLGKKGEWTRQEWLPSLVLLSAHLGALPSSLGPSSLVSWMPVESVARVVLELSEATSCGDASGKVDYFNCVNPAQTTWSKLVPAVVEFYESRGCKLDVVPLADWVRRVEQEEDVSKNPAAKLLETYRSWAAAEEAKYGEVKLSVEKCKGCSPTLKDMEVISPQIMQHWCEQWHA